MFTFLRRFDESHYSTEVYEDVGRGVKVAHVEARSQSSLRYEIVAGNDDGAFTVNPATGIVTSAQSLDYEARSFYNLTVAASNSVGARAQAAVSIHVLDVNDNPPVFRTEEFEGAVSETADVGSLVFVDGTNRSVEIILPLYWSRFNW